MWSKEISIETSASKAQIWKVWSDVGRWKSWDDQVIESSLEGSFMNGNTGVLIPKGGPKSKFELVDLHHEKSFTSRSKLPFAKMDFVHSMDEKDGKLILSHKIEMKGPLSFLFSRVIGKKLIQELPKALNKLDVLAKKETV